MSEQRIKELELRLIAATETVASLARVNAELAGRISETERRNKKLKRTARRDVRTFKEQLLVAVGRRS